MAKLKIDLMLARGDSFFKENIFVVKRDHPSNIYWQTSIGEVSHFMSGLFNILASFLIMPSIIHHKYVLNSLLIVGPIGNRPFPGIFLLLFLWPVSDFHSQSPIYHIQASGTHQPIHFLKAHDISSPHSEGNTNTKKKTFTKIMIKTKTPSE